MTVEEALIGPSEWLYLRIVCTIKSRKYLLRCQSRTQLYWLKMHWAVSNDNGIHDHFRGVWGYLETRKTQREKRQPLQPRSQDQSSLWGLSGWKREATQPDDQESRWSCLHAESRRSCRPGVWHRTQVCQVLGLHVGRPMLDRACIYQWTHCSRYSESSLELPCW